MIVISPESNKACGALKEKLLIMAFYRILNNRFHCFAGFFFGRIGQQRSSFGAIWTAISCKRRTATALRLPSLRAGGEATQKQTREPGLLRCARNDERYVDELAIGRLTASLTGATKTAILHHPMGLICSD